MLKFLTQTTEQQDKQYSKSKSWYFNIGKYPYFEEESIWCYSVNGAIINMILQT